MGKKRSILILCGGTGPRLWPLSRASRPKQFLKIFNNESFLKQSVVRALSVLSKEDIYLVSNARYVEQIKADIKGLLPEKNIIAEPEKKNTMMAIMYGVAKVGGGCVAVLPSDHYIEDNLRFKKDLNKAFDLAEKNGSIVTIGIKPSWANPGFGYIDTEKTKEEFLRVVHFVEKPEEKKASSMISKGAMWNSGMYIFNSEVLESELAKNNKEYFQLWEKLKDWSDKNVKKIYQLSPTLQIDKVISEKSRNMICITAGFDWSDVGEWGAIYKKLMIKGKENVLIGKESTVVEDGSSNCLIKGVEGKLIGLVGVKDLAIIDTEDALLVCNLNNSYQVKNLITKIVADKKLAKYFLKENNER